MMLHLNLATVMTKRRQSVSNVRLPSAYMMSHKRMNSLAYNRWVL